MVKEKARKIFRIFLTISVISFVIWLGCCVSCVSVQKRSDPYEFYDEKGNHRVSRPGVSGDAERYLSIAVILTLFLWISSGAVAYLFYDELKNRR